MAVEVNGTMIRIPQGDTGNVKFVADGELSESNKALFTIARRDGSAVLRKVLSVDESDKAFHLPFAYSETARMQPDSYEWSLRVVRGGKLDASGRLEDTQGSHTAILRGTLTILPVAGGAR